MKVEFVSYNGKYPNLCRGTLILKLDEKEYEFPKYCLDSGGSVWFSDDRDAHVEMGKWAIVEFPEGWPEEAKKLAIKCVNKNIECGCCGGCI